MHNTLKPASFRLFRNDMRDRAIVHKTAVAGAVKELLDDGLQSARAQLAHKSYAAKVRKFHLNVILDFVAV